jgi:hypothetical protein
VATHYLLQFFDHSHLRPELGQIVQPFKALAEQIDESLPTNPEKATALRKLLEAKDCAVRARLFKEEG